MTRASGIAGAFVVALALAPVSADAQQIFACVQNSSGTVRVVPQFVSCGNTMRAWSAGMSSDHKGRPALLDLPVLLDPLGRWVHKDLPVPQAPQAQSARKDLSATLVPRAPPGRFSLSCSAL